MGFLSDIVDGITGRGAARAARDGAQIQADAANRSIDRQEQALSQITELNQPFLQAGTGAIQGLLDFNNPQTQAEFVMNNPLFQALAQDTQQRVMQNQAARGLLGSSGTAQTLGQQLLPLGLQFAQQQRNNLAQTVGIGQNALGIQGNAITGNANNITSLLGQGANAQAAGGVGSANAVSAGANNLLNLGTSAAFLLSDRRAKRNIQKLGMHKGYNKYAFQYHDDDQWYIGVMADEVQKANPDAVREIGGYLRVNYGAL